LVLAIDGAGRAAQTRSAPGRQEPVAHAAPAVDQPPFSESPIILALRHPCDVILSNYMQNFSSKPFTVLCSSLERLAQGVRQRHGFLDLPPRTC
jgi:hypothetical protein